MKSNHLLLLCLFTFMLFSKVKAQDFEIFADAEGGIPFSGSLREFHEELTDQIPFDNVETSDNFNYNYGFTVGFRLYNKASVFYSNKVSGAKSSVADYSGFIRLTNELQGYTFGVEYELLLKEFKTSNLNFGAKGMMTSSNLILTTDSRILNNAESESLEFNALDFGGAVGLNYEYSIGSIALRAHLDFNILVGGKLTLKDDDSDGFLTNQNGGKVTTGWTSISGGVGLIFPVF